MVSALPHLARGEGVLFMVPFDHPLEYVCPGGTMAGAHTNNAQYFNSDATGLTLRSVCWLAVGGKFGAAESAPGLTGVCPGKYSVEVQFSTKRQSLNFAMDVSCTTPDGKTNLGSWTPAPRPKAKRVPGGVRTSVLGEVDVLTCGVVGIHFQNTEGGWKEGITWKALALRRK
jgi:hypothetical protein